MDKNEVALQLTLKALEQFEIKTSEYGGETLTEHAEIFSEVVAKLYNGIYENIVS